MLLTFESSITENVHSGGSPGYEPQTNTQRGYIPSSVPAGQTFSKQHRKFGHVKVSELVLQSAVFPTACAKARVHSRDVEHD